MDMIWVHSDVEEWEPAHLIGSDAKSVTVRLQNGNEVKVPGDPSQFDPVLQESLNEDCENLVELESFSEGIILHHVKQRFKQNVIYTFVGNILIALNPYKPLPLYEAPTIDKIYRLTQDEEPCPPHVFSIGSLAVHNMKLECKDQSVLISGESGAGKTEATKRILQLMSTVCSSTASRVGTSIENQILDSNPILESFGNAKTIRNNNSSRFGKYMEINFTKAFRIKGCNVTAYLLEKSRVVKQGPNERNYHVFYMLLSGATKTMKTELMLKPADQFHYLTQSGCMEIERRSDLKEFEEMVFAMNSLGIDIALQQQMFQCLASVLHLGNLTFAASRDVDGGSKVTSQHDCRRTASLLGINAEGLETSLCSKVNIIHGESVAIALSPEKAVDQRDALAKCVYGKIFDEVVRRVNSSLYRGKPGCSIGVLDIFGFEVFKLNSFEQLCINYCNERLQTFFNEVIFEGEMKMYAAEGLPCDDITYQDNVGCVRLIDLRGAGIFAYLDEEIAIPKGSDEKFVSKLNNIFDENANTRSVYFGRSRKSPLEFAVRHFAGDVTYNAKAFMEKNKDALAEGLVQLLQRSSIAMLSSTVSATGEGSGDNPVGGSGGKVGAKKASKLTLAAKFKLDLDNLMTALRSTEPHFIRCVKPNNFQQPEQFEAKLVLNQLKYSGLFEAIRIRKAGYAVRMTIDSFIRRYKHCALLIPGNVRQDPKQHAQAILVEMEKSVDFAALAEALLSHSTSSVPVTASAPSRGSQIKRQSTRGSIIHRQWVVGNTKVFIRTLPFRQQLEKIRDKNKGNAVVPIQSVVRMFIVKSRMMALVGEKRRLAAERKKQEATARSFEQKLMAEEDRLSFAVENVFRSDAALQKRLAEAKAERIRVENEKNFKKRSGAAVKIQTIVRGRLRGQLGRIYMCESMLETALQKRDERLICRAIQFPSIMGVTSKLIKTYQASAKVLIMEVLSEAHVSSELTEAVEVGSVPLLRAAIKKAELARMPYLPELKTARKLLDQLSMTRTILARLETILVKCVTVPKLITHVDQLQPLVQQASELGLAGEFLVQDAALRLSKVRLLIELRDRLRFAVEICSPSRMKSAMKERTRLLRIFGPELLDEESRAVEGMFDMLNYQQSVDVTQFHQQNDAGPATTDGSLSMHELYEVISDEATAAATDVEGSALSGSAPKRYEQSAQRQQQQDVYLPPFVRKVLEEMRASTAADELAAAVAKFVKLVPDELKRKFYVRIFKWVVAFAIWKYPSAAKRHMASQHDTQDPQQQFISSPAAAATASPARSNQLNSGSPRHTAVSVTPQRAKAVNVGRDSPSKSTMVPQAQQRNFGTTSPTAKKGMSSNDSSSPAFPARKTSIFIPFAQRQAKSHVAAREILKKGAKQRHVEVMAKTDTLFKESREDYERFKATIQTPSTFRG